MNSNKSGTELPITPNQHEIDSLPSFIPSWKAFYTIVVINLLLLISVFFGIQQYFK